MKNSLITEPLEQSGLEICVLSWFDQSDTDVGHFG